MPGTDQLLAHLPDGVTVKLRLSQDCSGSNLESLSTPEPVSHPDSVADPNGGPNILLASISVNKDTASGPSAIHVDAGASSSSAVSRPASSYIPNDVQVADFPARMEAYIDYDLGMPGELDCRISPPSFGIENDVMDLEIENRAAFFVSSPPISDIWARGSSLPKLQHSLWPQGVSFHLLIRRNVILQILKPHETIFQLLTFHDRFSKSEWPSDGGVR